MFYRRILSFAAALVLAVTAGEAVFAKTLTQRNNGDKKNARVSAPLNIAILMQDDLISQVGNELNVTRDFIRALPEGSRVMVRRADGEAAAKFIADLSEPADASAPIDDDTLALLADESKGWSDPSTGAEV